MPDDTTPKESEIEATVENPPEEVIQTEVPEPESETLPKTEEKPPKETAQQENEPFISEPEPVVADEPEPILEQEAEDLSVQAEEVKVSEPTPPVPQPPPESPPVQAPPPPLTITPLQVARDLLVKARASIQSRKRKKLDKILVLLDEKRNIANDDVEKLLHVSDATATRYLNQLEKERKIIQVGKTGRAVRYVKSG